MSDRPYCRIYFEVMDDPKFDGVRDDATHFGTWALMLLVADMAWPASAFIPPVPAESVALLVERQLIDVLPGNRFRIRGLDKERGERRERAKFNGGLRRSTSSARPEQELSNSSASALQLQSNSSALAFSPRDIAEATPLLAKPSRAETETSNPPYPPSKGGRRADATNPRSIAAKERALAEEEARLKGERRRARHLAYLDGRITAMQRLDMDRRDAPLDEIPPQRGAAFTAEGVA